MAILRYRRIRETQGPAKDPHRPVAAPHLAGDADRPIGFADIAALPEPDWATAEPYHQFEPGRYTVDALVPAGQLATVALDDGSLYERMDAVAAVWFDMFDDDAESEADR